MQSKGPCKYSIGFEPHKVGPNGQLKMHFHAYVIYDFKIETTNARYFDFKEVHPNIVKGKPGVGFLDYTQKNGDFTVSPTSHKTPTLLPWHVSQLKGLLNAYGRKGLRTCASLVTELSEM